MAKKFTFEANRQYHFFASSIAEWRVDTDVEKLIKFMKAGGFSFTLFFVPVDPKEKYKINAHIPEVEGAEFLGVYKMKG